MNKLKTIESSIRRLEGLLLVNEEYMDDSDIQDLKTTIDDLKTMYAEERRLWYTKQLQTFVEYLKASIAYRDQDMFEDFTSKPFIIKHDDHEVTIENSADVYESLLGLLQDELDEYK